LVRGLHPWDAVIDATTNRFRPIVLTAAAASLGMIPIASEVFWGPMAYAIIGGLFVATLLTLLFLPALYVAWFRIKLIISSSITPSRSTTAVICRRFMKRCRTGSSGATSSMPSRGVRPS
jgi:hypothetical protein